MRDTRSLAHCVRGILAAVVLASPAAAISFDLSVVANQQTAVPAGSGTFTSFNPFPAVSQDNVAIIGFGVPLQRGVYLFDGGALVRVVDLNTAVPAGTGTFSNIISLALSGTTVAFRGVRGIDQEGFYLFEHGALSRVVDLNTPIPAGSGTFESFTGGPSLSGRRVTFNGRGSQQEGVYLFDGSQLRRVADRNTGIPDATGRFTFFGVPSVSGDIVAFRGFGNGPNGIYAFGGGTLRRVADVNTAIPAGRGNFTNFTSLVSLSGANVAFRGVGSGEEGIYLSSGGSLKRVADLTTSIPGGTGNFTSFSDFPALSGNNVAFLARGNAGQEGVYLFADGALSRVADRNTPIPDGTGTFAELTEPVLSGGKVGFRALGSSGQAGIYSFAGSGLSRVADRNITVPGGGGTFVSFSRPSQSGSSIAYSGVAANGQGIYVATPSAGVARFEGGGKAQNVGSERDNGNVRISGRFALPPGLPLERASLTVIDVLNEAEGAGELARAVAGGPPVPLTLSARAGSNAKAAIYETPSGAMPRVRVEIKNRDPQSRPAEFAVTVDRDRLSTPVGCAIDPAGTAELETSFELRVGSERVVIHGVLPWRCARGQLTTP